MVQNRFTVWRGCEDAIASPRRILASSHPRILATLRAVHARVALVR